MEEQTQTQFNGWALVEIMGHRRAAGEVTTKYIGTAAFLHVVTPEVPPTLYTVDSDRWIDGSRVYAGSIMEASRPRSEIYIGSGSIYAMTPIAEDEVLSHAPLTHKVIQAAERKLIEGATELPDNPDEDDDEKDDLPY